VPVVKCRNVGYRNHPNQPGRRHVVVGVGYGLGRIIRVSNRGRSGLGLALFYHIPIRIYFFIHLNNKTMSVNKVILMGRVGKEVVVRTSDKGTKVASFSMATSETYKDKNTGERKEITEWHNIAIFGPLVTVAEKYLKKGDQIYVEGKLKTRSWEKDGITRYNTDVVIDVLNLIGGSKPAVAAEQKEEAYA
jgi:single-strand DNA-binding protein